jgi:hypothetical protein
MCQRVAFLAPVRIPVTRVASLSPNVSRSNVWGVRFNRE